MERALVTRIAVAQMKSSLLDVASNGEKIIRAIFKTATNGAEIVVFPECALTGYNMSIDEARQIAIRVPSEGLQPILEACSETGVLAAIGLLEDEGDQIYNTAVVIGPTGILGRYRKTHLPLLGIDRFISPGHELMPPFKTDHGRVGLLVCYDIRFPEPIRVLALSGAQIILLPTAWPEEATLYTDFLIRARAGENRVYIAAANHVGQEREVHYLGRSLIAAPDGEILAEGSPEEESILYCDIDPAWSDQKRLVFSEGEYELDLFGDRREDLYGRIVGER